MFPYILSVLLGYLIGSFPTAYVVLKWKARIDIRTSGSGNVGAMNAYGVTGSKVTGIAVMVIDMFKGAVAVGICWIVSGNDISVTSAGAVGSILGHNYPVWLKFKGGRGLATAAGVMLVLGWPFFVTWCVLWGIFFLMWKQIHRANILAILLSPLILFALPAELITSVLPAMMNYFLFMYLVIIISIILFIRHLDTIKDSLKPSTHQSS